MDAIPTSFNQRVALAGLILLATSLTAFSSGVHAHCELSSDIDVPGDGQPNGTGGNTSSEEAQPSIDANYHNTVEYPSEAIRKRHIGVVDVVIDVNTDGTALNVSISQSSGFPELDKAAVTSLKNWHFHPGTRGISAIESQISLQVQFNNSGISVFTLSNAQASRSTVAIMAPFLTSDEMKPIYLPIRGSTASDEQESAAYNGTLQIAMDNSISPVEIENAAKAHSCQSEQTIRSAYRRTASDPTNVTAVGLAFTDEEGYVKAFRLCHSTGDAFFDQAFIGLGKTLLNKYVKALGAERRAFLIPLRFEPES
jgi:TonB family protein